MSRIRYTKQSRADLIDIWLRLAVRDEATANRVLDAITGRCSQLADFPELGRTRSEISKDVRALVIERWLVLYRVEGSLVQVVRVVDAVRDLTALDLSPVAAR